MPPRRWLFYGVNLMAYNDIVQAIADASQDADTLEKVVNGEPNAQAKSRLGRLIYTLATINHRVDIATTQANQKLNDLDAAISAAAAAGAGANGWTDLLIKLANGRSQRDKNSELISILDFFTINELTAFKSNQSMDMTAIIKRAFATGVKKLNFLDLQMHITPDVSTGLGITFASGDIELYGNGATFIDDTVYLNNDKVAALFTLGGAVTSFKSNINYVGKPVDLGTQIGYIGATYVYSKGANKNITVNARFENIRYGILAGGYADPTLGGAKTIRGNLDCKNVGYPLATYLADDIEMTITGDGFHRVHYIAGCNHARMTTRTKNYYIAPIANFYTDAKTGAGTSKGCSDCQTDATDLGSTNYVANSYLMGISLSRVDPNTVFDSIILNGKIIGNNTQASTLGHSIINSTAKNYQPSYTTNWIADIFLKNIKTTGLIDRSAQTITEHGLGEVYIAAVDDLSVPGQNFYPTMSNFSSSITYLPGSGDKPRGFFYMLYGLIDVANFERMQVPQAPFLLRTNSTSTTKVINSNIKGVDYSASAQLNSKIDLIDTEIWGGADYVPLTNKRFSNTKVGNDYHDNSLTSIKTVSNVLSLSGSSVTWTAALPNNSIIFAVSLVITENIVGARGMRVGDATNNSKYFNLVLSNAGTGASLSALVDPKTLPSGQIGNGGIIITAKENADGSLASFTSGKVKVVVHYLPIPVPSL